jgi:phosphatidylinositol-3-phosphatase
MIFSNSRYPGKWIFGFMLSIILLTGCAVFSPNNIGGQKAVFPSSTSVQMQGTSGQSTDISAIAPTGTPPVSTRTALIPTSTPAKTKPPFPTPTTKETGNTPNVEEASPLPTQPGPITQGQKVGVPSFDHVVIILFENRDFNEVIGNQNLPNFNRLATENILFTRYYAVAHPSLPNYLALIGGSTFGVTNDCGGCFVNSASLPDLIEASGRTWKTYQEDMPAACYHGSSGQYAQTHNPFMYFDPIRTNMNRCDQGVVPLSELNRDLSANELPNYAFIVPNVCHSAHSCNLSVADAWLDHMVNQLQIPPALGHNSMIFIVFDEASSDNTSCCGLPVKAGGRVAAILISPLAKSGFQDETPLSHYSLLKTIILSWNLPELGNTENPATVPITSPWK